MTHCSIRKVLKIAAVVLALCGCLALAPKSASANVKGVYVDTAFYPASAATQSAAVASGFNTMFIFAVNVNADGTLTWAGNTLVQNGTYVGNPNWGSSLAPIKAAGINFEVVLGGWTNQSFTNIKNLIASQGTGTNSILYKNFLALKNACGPVAIQYDDELTYDVSSAVSFGFMVSSLGMKVTLCPYTNSGYWASVLSQLGTNIVSAVYLQCYDGGAGNDPGAWISALGGYKVYPGLWGNTDTPGSTAAKIRNWQNAYGLSGCFLWLNGGMPGDAAKWAQALHYGIDPIPYFMICNKNSGLPMELTSGNSANGSGITQQGYSTGPNQRWALTPTENGAHFKLINWTSGKTAGVSGDSNANSAAITNYEYNSDPYQMWDIIDAGLGYFKIKNVGSGLLMEVAGGNTAAGATIQQYGDNGTPAQMWRLNPYGGYYIRSAVSGRYVCVQSGGSSNGSQIVQYDWQNNPWFRWNFANQFDGWYAVYTQNASTKVISVINDSTTPGALTQLYDYNNDPAQRIRIWPRTNGAFTFYFSHDNLAWDIVGGQTGNNVALSQYTNNNSLAQQFYLERAQ